jgi:putative ABC transport system permease protein
VLEGRRPVREARVARLVDDLMGLSAYMEIGALHRLLREGGVVTGAALHVDGAATSRLYCTLKALPAVAGVALTEAALRNFREVLSRNMDLTILINIGFAAVIAFGVVYNSARISLSERSRDLASLRVLGFTRAEISLILLGELAILTLLALPAGGVLGWIMGRAIVASFASEVYRIPFLVTRSALAWSALVVIAAAAFSGLVVRRKLDRLDLIAVLKTRE